MPLVSEKDVTDQLDLTSVHTTMSIASHEHAAVTTQIQNPSFRREKSASGESDMPQVKPVTDSSHFLLPGLTNFLSSVPCGVGT